MRPKFPHQIHEPFCIFTQQILSNIKCEKCQRCQRWKEQVLVRGIYCNQLCVPAASCCFLLFPASLYVVFHSFNGVNSNIPWISIETGIIIGKLFNIQAWLFRCFPVSQCPTVVEPGFPQQTTTRSFRPFPRLPPSNACLITGKGHACAAVRAERSRCNMCLWCLEE